MTCFAHPQLKKERTNERFISLYRPGEVALCGVTISCLHGIPKVIPIRGRRHNRLDEL
jgi:hypothetical protein